MNIFGFVWLFLNVIRVNFEKVNDPVKTRVGEDNLGVIINVINGVMI